MAASRPVLDKLTKVLDLERQQGHANRAVIGGLDAFLPHWRREAEGVLPAELITAVVEPLEDYGALPAEERRARVARTLAAAREAEGRARGGGRGARGSRGARGRSSAGSAGSASRRSAGNGDGPRARRQASGQRSTGSGGAAEGDGSDVPDEPSVAAVGPERDAPRTHDDPQLERPVIHLRRFGKKATERLARLGVETIRDLLFHVPARYEDYSQLKKISQLRVGDDVTVVGTVWDVKLRRLRGKRTLLTLVLNDTTGTLACTFFNQPYLKREFKQGRQIAVSGTVEPWSGRLVLKAPKWEPVDRDLVHTARLVPVYPLTEGLSQRWLRSRMKHVVDEWVDALGDPLPAALRAEHELPSLPAALAQVHFPERRADLERARDRLAFDELLTLQLWARQRRQARRAEPGVSLADGEPARQALVEALPFELTGAQARALDEIAADLATSAPMSRLLQGDVGSGKTAVAAGAIAQCVGAGYQAALMAPTEILAEQHFRSLAALLRPVGYRPFDPAAADEDGADATAAIENAGDATEAAADATDAAGRADGPCFALLTGSMRASDKARVVEAVRDGSVDLLVGTHALIQDGVAFERLALSVVDEQHRFGVMQRAELATGDADEEAVPHQLIMTATPIPRTLAMVINADLDQSVIDELPPGRKPTRTVWLRPRERERGYQYIRARVAAGEQAYIVYPLVEESDAIEARAATEEHERLSRDVFADLEVGLLHGRMRAAEKEEVMRRFRDGALDVLVATTVIEVGVDVPNATVMLIDGADRFGLAQLHQLRGRVGRGSAESACLLLADDPSPRARERLEAMTKTTDGLVLAERDLEMRGPGDYFGTQQSGLVDRFRFARTASPAVIAEAARAAERLLADDPELADPAHAALRKRVARFTAAAERA